MCSRCPCATALKSRLCRRRMVARRLWRCRIRAISSCRGTGRPVGHGRASPRPRSMAGARSTSCFGHGRIRTRTGVGENCHRGCGAGLCHRRDHPERLGRRADLPRGHARGHHHLAQEEDARESAALEVEVDRGVATYPYPLPEATTEDFINGRKGWGEAQNEGSSPSYVEIAANPSATVQVKRDGEVLGGGRLGRGTGARPSRGFAASADRGGGARAQLGAHQGH